ncbi:UNVERIFIED_CONTAM: hypothetical protein FKN15_064719 [Acipenser sinensis]
MESKREQSQYRKAIGSLQQLASFQALQQQVPAQGSLEQHRALIQLASCHFALGEYRSQYRKAIGSLQQLASFQALQQQVPAQGSLEQHRALIQLASCHFALGEYRLTCEKVLEVICYMVPQAQDPGRALEEVAKVKKKYWKGTDLRLLPCTSKSIMPYCLQLVLACFKLRAFTDNRDDLALGHVIVLLQHDWPRGESLFLKAVDKICQEGNFQYENFFNYVTNIDMLEEFAYLRTTEGGKIHLELLPNQGLLINPAISVPDQGQGRTVALLSDLSVGVECCCLLSLKGTLALPWGYFRRSLFLSCCPVYRLPTDCLFVTDYFTRTPRKLNAFRSFASVELFHFNMPDDTVVAVWNLITFKEQGGTFGDSCPDRNVTVYFRSGAPPVINPFHTSFPKDTIVPGSSAVTLTWTLPNRTTGVFNITSPLPGDWFLAAHLPKDEGKISVKFPSVTGWLAVVMCGDITDQDVTETKTMDGRE